MPIDKRTLLAGRSGTSGSAGAIADAQQSLGARTPGGRELFSPMTLCGKRSTRCRPAASSMAATRSSSSREQRCEGSHTSCCTCWRWQPAWSAWTSCSSGIGSLERLIVNVGIILVFAAFYLMRGSVASMRRSGLLGHRRLGEPGVALNAVKHEAEDHLRDRASDVGERGPRARCRAATDPSPTPACLLVKPAAARIAAELAYLRDVETKLLLIRDRPPERALAVGDKAVTETLIESISLASSSSHRSDGR